MLMSYLRRRGKMKKMEMRKAKNKLQDRKPGVANEPVVSQELLQFKSTLPLPAK